MSTPGAIRSTQLALGLNLAETNLPPSLVPAPTATTYAVDSCRAAGQIFCLLGPWLPAAATTTTPCLLSTSTALVSTSGALSSSVAAPKEMLSTVTPEPAKLAILVATRHDDVARSSSLSTWSTTSVALGARSSTTPAMKVACASWSGGLPGTSVANVLSSTR